MVGVDTDAAAVEAMNCGGGCGSAVSLAIEWTINFVFTAEVVLKMVAEAPCSWRYFHSGWNTFDFLIVAFVYLPIGGSFVMVLRLLRLLRVLKLVRALPSLQVIVSALIKGLSSIGYIALLLTLILYLFAIVGMLLFRDNDPFHFGSLHLAMFSLFRASTLEDWADIMYVNMYGCDVFGYEGNYMLDRWCKAPASSLGFMWLTILYFLVFVTLSALCMMALFIGVVTTSMQEATDTQKEDKAEKQAVARLVADYGVHASRIEQFRELFNMFDVSGDGLIDIEEFTFAIRCIKEDATVNQIGDWMLLGDPDSIGEINFINFCRVMLELKSALATPQAPPAAPQAASPSRARAVRAMLKRVREHVTRHPSELMRDGSLFGSLYPHMEHHEGEAPRDRSVVGGHVHMPQLPQLPRMSELPQHLHLPKLPGMATMAGLGSHAPGKRHLKVPTRVEKQRGPPDDESSIEPSCSVSRAGAIVPAGAELKGEQLKRVLEALAATRRELRAQMHAQVARRNSGSHSDASLPPAWYSTFGRQMMLQLDEVEAELFVELQPKVVSVDTDTQLGNLLLGGRVVGQVRAPGAPPPTEATAAKQPVARSHSPEAVGPDDGAATSSTVVDIHGDAAGLGIRPIGNSAPAAALFGETTQKV